MGGGVGESQRPRAPKRLRLETVEDAGVKSGCTTLALVQSEGGATSRAHERSPLLARSGCGDGSRGSGSDDGEDRGDALEASAYSEGQTVREYIVVQFRKLADAYKAGKEGSRKSLGSV